MAARTATHLGTRNAITDWTSVAGSTPTSQRPGHGRRDRRRRPALDLVRACPFAFRVTSVASSGRERCVLRSGTLRPQVRDVARCVLRSRALRPQVESACVRAGDLAGDPPRGADPRGRIPAGGDQHEVPEPVAPPFLLSSYRAYAVLTLCRILHSNGTGRAASKSAAAAWVSFPGSPDGPVDEGCRPAVPGSHGSVSRRPPFSGDARRSGTSGSGRRRGSFSRARPSRARKARRHRRHDPRDGGASARRRLAVAAPTGRRARACRRVSRAEGSPSRGASRRLPCRPCRGAVRSGDGGGPRLR